MNNHLLQLLPLAIVGVLFILMIFNDTKKRLLSRSKFVTLKLRPHHFTGDYLDIYGCPVFKAASEYFKTKKLRVNLSEIYKEEKLFYKILGDYSFGDYNFDKLTIKVIITDTPELLNNYIVREIYLKRV